MTPALITHIFCRAFLDSSSSSAPLKSLSILSSKIPFIFTYPPKGSNPIVYIVSEGVLNELKVVENTFFHLIFLS